MIILFQIRHSQCYAKINNITRKVEDSLCNNAGLVKPQSFEICGLERCSYWNISQWSEVSGL